MRTALGGDLRKMGDGEDLHVGAHVGDHGAHAVGGTAGHAGVDLVEHHGRHVGVAGHHRLEGQHDPGYLTARGTAGEIDRFPARGGEFEQDRVRAGRAGSGGFNRHREKGLFQFKGTEGVADGRGESRSGGFAGFVEPAGEAVVGRFFRGDVPVEILQAVLEGIPLEKGA